MRIKRIARTAKFGHRFGRKNEFICVSSAFAAKGVKRRGKILAVLSFCHVDTPKAEGFFPRLKDGLAGKAHIFCDANHLLEGFNDRF